MRAEALEKLSETDDRDPQKEGFGARSSNCFTRAIGGVRDAMLKASYKLGNGATPLSV